VTAPVGSRSPDARTRAVDLVVVTGMSGSGKSTAIAALEDEGYYCIDNLPTALVERFVELCAGSSDLAGLHKVALGLDLRDSSYVEKWPQVRRRLEAAGHDVFVVFLDASDEVLLRRFSETRRAHPLGGARDLPEAIAAERRMLASLKERSSLVIDTGDMTVHELKRRVREVVSGQANAAKTPAITVKSFGFKYGIATDADMVFDVRFLPNPHFVDQLRPLTGNDKAVADYVMERAETRDFLVRLRALLEFLLPLYQQEGRSYLTLAIGCTGGRHRSVTLASVVGEFLRERGHAVIVRHRDVERGT
jgi:UPF0042 nucleotide-binding protein